MQVYTLPPRPLHVVQRDIQSLPTPSPPVPPHVPPPVPPRVPPPVPPPVPPHVPDGFSNDDEVTNLQRTLEKTRMERDRINRDKEILERRLSEYEDLLAASRIEHKFLL